MQSLNYSFKNLRELMKARLESRPSVSSASHANLFSALNGFLAERGQCDDSVIGQTLRSSYYRNVASHVDSLKSQSRSRTYIANRKTLLARWRRVVLEADRASAAQFGRVSPFQTGLRELVEQAPSRKAVARASGIPFATLSRWLDGSAPNTRSAKWVPHLERYFGLVPGTLGDLLPFRPKSSLDDCSKTAPIAYRERLKLQHKQHYALKDADGSLKSEWACLLAYKVSLGSSSRHRLLRSKTGKWSATTNPASASQEHAWYAFHSGRYVASAHMTWQMVSRYLGWLVLETSAGGKGLPRSEAMTLGNLVRDDLLADYCEWATARSGGKANGGTVRFLQFVESLCHPQTGFMTQSCEVFLPGAEAAQRDTWLADCQFAFDFARTLRNDLRGSVEASRNSFEPIKSMLALANPLEAVADAVARLDADRPTTGGQAEAIWARDRLLLKLLASNPLRIKNVQLLTYHADGSGHLRQGNGAWRICIPRSDFKNARGAAHDRIYDMPVRPEVWSDIEQYLRDYRPMLSSTGGPYVFVSTESGGGPMFGLRRRFEVLSRRYFAGCPGVGPHAMRHLVATSILKQRPNDWAAAAWALHDREDTIRQHYAHLRSDDAFKWFDTAMAGPFSRM